MNHFPDNQFPLTIQRQETLGVRALNQVIVNILAIERISFRRIFDTHFGLSLEKYVCESPFWKRHES